MTIYGSPTRAKAEEAVYIIRRTIAKISITLNASRLWTIRSESGSSFLVSLRNRHANNVQFRVAASEQKVYVYATRGSENEFVVQVQNFLQQKRPTCVATAQRKPFWQ